MDAYFSQPLSSPKHLNKRKIDIEIHKLISKLLTESEFIEKDDITGKYVFDAYSRDAQKTKEINGKDWETYQTPGNFFSPPFSEFVSGHSTFSSAAGKFIEEITGSTKFGASVKTTSLIEKNKNIPVKLKWDTWEDAWNESGISRIYGGIHFDDGNEQGLKLGQEIGSAVFKEVSNLWG